MKLFQTIVLVTLISLSGLKGYAQENEYNLDETYQVAQDGTVHLSSDDAEVEITGTDRSDVHLVVFRKLDIDAWKLDSKGEFKVEAENRNGDLFIREAGDEEHKIIMGSIREEYRITLEVPREVALELDGDDDSYEISNINRGVNISADDAEIEISDVKGDNFEFEIDDGTIRMDEGRGSLRLTMDDGELYVRSADFSEIETDFDDGKLDISTTLADDGFYLFNMDDGDVELNIIGGGGEFDIRHDDSNIFVSDDFKEMSSEENRTVYRLAGGEAKVEFDTDDADIDLRTL